MKVTFEETLSRKEWLHKELMNSLTGEVIEKAKEDRFYDVKLLVNGVEIEPVFYNDIMNGVEKYIDAEAELRIINKLQDIEDQTQKLKEFVDEAIEKIKEKFL